METVIALLMFLGEPAVLKEHRIQLCLMFLNV